MERRKRASSGRGGFVKVSAKPVWGFYARASPQLAPALAPQLESYRGTSCGLQGAADALRVRGCTRRGGSQRAQHCNNRYFCLLLW